MSADQDRERVVAEAADVLMSAFTFPENAWKAARALAAAGLLVSDLHREALDACERFALAWDGPPTPGPELYPTCVDVGRRSLALKASASKGKEPRSWEACKAVSPSWDVRLVQRDGTTKVIGPFNESQARIVANALNQEAASE